jgi:hypothetical protein
MSDIALARSVRDHLSKAPPILVIAIVALVGLTYYGLMLNLASAPHLQNIDRATFLQAEQIKLLTADLAELKRQNDEMRKTIASRSCGEITGECANPPARPAPKGLERPPVVPVETRRRRRMAH